MRRKNRKRRRRSHLRDEEEEDDGTRGTRVGSPALARLGGRGGGRGHLHGLPFCISFGPRRGSNRSREDWWRRGIVGDENKQAVPRGFGNEGNGGRFEYFGGKV